MYIYNIDREINYTHRVLVLWYAYADTRHNLRCNVICPLVNLKESERGPRPGRLDVLGWEVNGSNGWKGWHAVNGLKWLNAGYTPSVATLACNAATLTPAPRHLKFENINVIFGAKLQAAVKGMMLQTAPADSADALFFSVASNTFRLRVTKATFTCNANPCVIPTVEKSSGNGCKGVSGKTVESGKVPLRLFLISHWCCWSCKRHGNVTTSQDFGKSSVKLKTLTQKTFIDSCKNSQSLQSETSPVTSAGFQQIYTLNFKGCQCKSSESSAIFSAVKCHKLAMSCHVQVCDTMCKAGYTPSVKRLNCLAETLTPATFVCNPDPCPIPFDKNQAQHDATLWRHVMSPVARHVLS